jgi:hypothetical protein
MRMQASSPFAVLGFTAAKTFLWDTDWVICKFGVDVTVAPWKVSTNRGEGTDTNDYRNAQTTVRV